MIFVKRLFLKRNWDIVLLKMVMNYVRINCADDPYEHEIDDAIHFLKKVVN